MIYITSISKYTFTIGFTAFTGAWQLRWVLLFSEALQKVLYWLNIKNEAKTYREGRKGNESDEADGCKKIRTRQGC
jgi:hypothetical protein